MSRTLLAVILLTLNFALSAMLPEIDHCQWVEIMSNKDGVIIESDPDSSTILPNIEQSYFSLKAEERPATDNSPLMRKHIVGINFSALIIDQYPVGMDAMIAKMHVIYVLKKDRSNLKKSWFNF